MMAEGQRMGDSGLSDGGPGRSVRGFICWLLVVCTIGFSALCLVGCGSSEYEVAGKYYSTSKEGIQVSIEFDNHQLRLSSDYNQGPWRDYKRQGNTITVSGIGPNRQEQTLTIEVLDNKNVEVKNFIGGQDAQFRKH